jgi:hypothetical protein
MFFEARIRPLTGVEMESEHLSKSTGLSLQIR